MYIYIDIKTCRYIYKYKANGNIKYYTFKKEKKKIKQVKIILEAGY